MRDTLDAAKKAVPHLIANEVASTIANAAKKRKRLDIGMTRSQEPQLKKAFVDTGGIDINALIDGSGIVLDKLNDWIPLYQNFTKPMLRVKTLNPLNTMKINQLLVHNLIVLGRLQ